MRFQGGAAVVVAEDGDASEAVRGGAEFDVCVEAQFDGDATMFGIAKRVRQMVAGGFVAEEGFAGGIRGVGTGEDEAFDEESGGEGVVFGEGAAEAGADDEDIVAGFKGELDDGGGVERRGCHDQRGAVAGEQRGGAVGGGLYGELSGDRELLEGGGGVAGVEALGREAAFLAEEEDIGAIAGDLGAELAGLIDGGGGVDAADAPVHEYGDDGGGAEHVDHDAGAVGRCGGGWGEGDIDVHRASVVGRRRSCRGGTAGTCGIALW